MYPLLLTITTALVAAQIFLPKRLAFLPLIIVALHTNYNEQVIPSFTIARLIIIVGLFRAVFSGQFRCSMRNPIDLLMVLWATFALISTIFHEPTISHSNPFIYRVRLVIDICGSFFYAKAYIHNFSDLKRLAIAISITLVPLALAMGYTKLTGGSNIYSLIGADASLRVRNGSIRAFGPFGNAILAGTVGSLLMPLILILWSKQKKVALIGIFCCLTMIFSSGSSTPIGALLIALFALSLWRYRQYMKGIVISGITLLILMDLVKERPIWYLIALTDFTGSSTGYHRAKLIDQAILYFDEWWFFGTDYTRHWMPYGLASMPDHADITNYYIHMGVIGGLPLVIIVLALIWKGFAAIKPPLKRLRLLGNENEFGIWCVGCLLFTHTLTCLTISYYDQSYIFFFLLLAFISNLKSLLLEPDSALESISTSPIRY